MPTGRGEPPSDEVDAAASLAAELGESESVTQGLGGDPDDLWERAVHVEDQEEACRDRQRSDGSRSQPAGAGQL